MQGRRARRTAEQTAHHQVKGSTFSHASAGPGRRCLQAPALIRPLPPGAQHQRLAGAPPGAAHRGFQVGCWSGCASQCDEAVFACGAPYVHECELAPQRPANRAPMASVRRRPHPWRAWGSRGGPQAQGDRRLQWWVRRRERRPRREAARRVPAGWRLPGLRWWRWQRHPAGCGGPAGRGRLQGRGRLPPGCLLGCRGRAGLTCRQQLRHASCQCGARRALPAPTCRGCRWLREAGGGAKPAAGWMGGR